MRITSISRMWCLRSASESSAGFQPESSAGFQPAVSQDFILQPDQTCQSVQVNSIGLQIKNLRYSPADAGRYAFGQTLTIEAPNHQGKRPKSRAREELKPLWMQFKKDEANLETRKNLEIRKSIRVIRAIRGQTGFEFHALFEFWISLEFRGFGFRV